MIDRSKGKQYQEDSNWAFLAGLPYFSDCMYLVWGLVASFGITKVALPRLYSQRTTCTGTKSRPIDNTIKLLRRLGLQFRYQQQSFVNIGLFFQQNYIMVARLNTVIQQYHICLKFKLERHQENIRTCTYRGICF